jgi:hypothetical protein
MATFLSPNPLAIGTSAGYSPPGASPTGRPAPRPGALFRCGHGPVTPLRWPAKTGTRLLLPLVLGRGWAARIRDVHSPILSSFGASFSCATSRSSPATQDRHWGGD